MEVKPETNNAPTNIPISSGPETTAEEGAIVQHARHEFTIHKEVIGDNRKESMILPYEWPIMEIARIFSRQGHSGGSAPYGIRAITDAIKHVLSFEPIEPIIDMEEDWSNDISGDQLYQHNRCPALFKDGKTGKAYYLDAIVWKAQNGHAWTGSTKEGYLSRQYVKFPFRPKSFYVDVIEKEVQKDDWEFTIKDMKQLDAVFEYYEKDMGFEKAEGVNA